MWWKVLPDGRDVHTLTVQKDTWCHCSPVETPTLVVAAGVGVEDDLYGVGQRCQGLCLEVIGMGGRDALRPAAASRHQGFPVSILDLDIVL